MTDRSSKEKRETRPGWWRDENPGREGNREISRFNRRQQKKRLIEELNQSRCPGPAFCEEIFCDYCSYL